MKYLVVNFFILFCKYSVATDFEVEILSTKDDIDVNIFEYSDIITFRQFKVINSWKDNFGDWKFLNVLVTTK